ncbi:MAG: DUF11 domain-containing protein, partial [Pseudomonadales bacterium]|nr:DUF11 domain-containing protein [Pseudomonadales bacterium]
MGAPRILWLAVLAGWSALATTASALDFDVSNPAEFQAALTTAQSNGQEDTINVLPCVLGEPGCTTLTDPVTNQSVVAYEFSTPLTYIAASTENFSLTIDGFDSDTRILAGDAAQILFIDTTAATDTGQTVWVRNLTFALGLPEAGDGGAVAIRVAGAFVQVSGSEFYGNRADNGGALFIAVTGASEAPIRLVDLTFEGNSARDSGGAAMVLATEFVNVEVRDIDFIGNNAVGGGGCLFVQNLEAGDGPIRVNEVLVDDVTFEQCEAGLDGGGAYLAANATTIRVSGFVENEAGGVGGGLFLEGGWGFLNVVNSGFAFNTAQSGGGMYTNPPVPFGDGTPNLINNTFVENNATNDGGNLYLAVGGTTAIARIYNNILFGGTTASATTGDDVYIDNDPFEDIPSRVEFYNNAITALPSGGFPNTNDSFFISGPSALVSGGNIDDPPQLLLTTIEDGEEVVSPDQLPTSPTIDAGRNDLVTPAFGVAIPNVDYDGDERPDGDVESGGTVDIGMDEFVPDATPTADLSVVASDSPDPVTEGGNLTYQVTVANAGPDAATSVALDVDFDDGVEFASATPGQGTCTASGDLASVSCALGTIADGDDVAVTIVVTVPEVLEPTTITAGFLVGNDAQFEPD